MSLCPDHDGRAHVSPERVRLIAVATTLGVLTSCPTCKFLMVPEHFIYIWVLVPLRCACELDVLRIFAHDAQITERWLTFLTITASDMGPSRHRAFLQALTGIDLGQKEDTEA